MSAISLVLARELLLGFLLEGLEQLAFGGGEGGGGGDGRLLALARQPDRAQHAGRDHDDGAEVDRDRHDASAATRREPEQLGRHRRAGAGHLALDLLEDARAIGLADRGRTVPVAIRAHWLGMALAGEVGAGLLQEAVCGSHGQDLSLNIGARTHNLHGPE